MTRTIKYLVTPEIKFETVAAGYADLLEVDDADEIEVLLDISFVRTEPDPDGRHDG